MTQFISPGPARQTYERDLAFFREEILPLCGRAETSATPAKWSSENPLQGHGVLVACFMANHVGMPIYCGKRVIADRPVIYYVNESDKKLHNMAVPIHHDEALPSLQETTEVTVEELMKKGSIAERYRIFEQNVFAAMAKHSFIFDRLAYRQEP